MEAVGDDKNRGLLFDVPGFFKWSGFRDDGPFTGVPDLAGDDGIAFQLLHEGVRQRSIDTLAFLAAGKGGDAVIAVFELIPDAGERGDHNIGRALHGRFKLIEEGKGYGSLMGIYPGFTQNRFGKKYHGVNYGIMFIALALAGYIGPMVTRVIQGMFGRFQPMFLVSAGLIFVGEILIVVLRKKER